MRVVILGKAAVEVALAALATARVAPAARLLHQQRPAVVEAARSHIHTARAAQTMSDVHVAHSLVTTATGHWCGCSRVAAPRFVIRLRL